MPRVYNVLYLFAATKTGSNGTVRWHRPDVLGDIRTVRQRGQRVVLVVGGSRQGITFASRAVSQRLVDSVVRINQQLGGTTTRPVLDGVDFNTFEAEDHPELDEYRWMARELRKTFGSSFGISSPPAPWSERDRQFCREMIEDDLFDYVGPQFYDGPGLADLDYIVDTTRDWVQNVAGGDASKIVVGFGIHTSKDYSSTDEVKKVWREIRNNHPTIRGMFLWEGSNSVRQRQRFANEVAPIT